MRKLRDKQSIFKNKIFSLAGMFVKQSKLISQTFLRYKLFLVLGSIWDYHLCSEGAKKRRLILLRIVLGKGSIHGATSVYQKLGVRY